MSQKKVDAYKQQKANRSKELKKEKMVRKLQKVAAAVIGLGVVCWIGFSVYGKYEEAQEAIVTEVEMDTTAIDDYVSELMLETEE